MMAWLGRSAYLVRTVVAAAYTKRALARAIAGKAPQAALAALSFAAALAAVPSVSVVGGSLFWAEQRATAGLGVATAAPEAVELCVAEAEQ